jgi:2-desacetyl-2-hydroxyethyl bacteriochlorophyllide A dehydrogenase
MKALVKQYAKPGLSLLDLEKPRIKNPDDVLFKVEYCAICAGEVKVYEWNEWAANDTSLQLPTVLGHEASGVVTEVGSQVTHLKPGDHVAPQSVIYCGSCLQCRRGRTNLCEFREIYGKRRGAFAEYAVLPERVIGRLNPKLSLEEGALLENMSVAVHAVEQESHDVGDWAVILGAGPIGVIAAQTLVAYGVNTIITDVLDWRLDFARKYSAATVIDIKQEDLVRRVMELTEGRGAGFVIEMCANQAAMDQAFEVVGFGGTIVTIGTFGNAITFNPFFKMSRREIKLQSSILCTWETWRRMNQLIDSGKMNLKPLISQVMPLEEYQRGFEYVKAGSVMKVLLRP